MCPFGESGPQEQPAGSFGRGVFHEVTVNVLVGAAVPCRLVSSSNVCSRSSSRQPLRCLRAGGIGVLPPGAPLLTRPRLSESAKSQQLEVESASWSPCQISPLSLPACAICEKLTTAHRNEMKPHLIPGVERNVKNLQAYFHTITICVLWTRCFRWGMAG